LISKEDIIRWLSKKVGEYCEAPSATAMALKRLGADFGNEFKTDFQRACAEAKVPAYAAKMIPFIQSFCADLEILPYEGRLDKAAVRPRGKDCPHPATVFQSNRPVGTEPRRYAPALWAAFIKPLAEGARRWISVEEPVHFYDLPATETPKDGTLEISREAIVAPPPNVLVNGEAVGKNISQWLSQHSIPADNVAFKSRGISPVARLTDDDFQRRPVIRSRDVSRQFFNMLPEEMKKRFQIPADIVEYILSLEK